MRRFVVLVALCAIASPFVRTTPASAAPISALSVDPTSISGGASATGTVTLIPDGTDTTLLLFSSDPDAASVPASIAVPAGQSTVTFTVTTNAAAPEEIVQISAAVGSAVRTKNISVNAAPPAGPSLSAVSANPSSLTGGSPSTGTVTFSGVTDGAVVDLSTDNPALVGVPAEVVVSGGASAVAFGITTAAVRTATTANITATWFGITRSTTITLVPGAPAPADRVAVTKARWKARLLTIEATSSNPNAVLSVFGPDGGFMFTLTNRGGGRYTDQRGWVFNPGTITVTSNLGGNATATVANG